MYYYHTDHLGTPQALTDEHGSLALEMDYQAWGQAREVIADAASKAGIRNPFRFQGQYHDDESGLHYNRYRYYDPEIGRFISRDPIGLTGGLNTHVYAPNPIEWVDALGLTNKKAICYEKLAKIEVKNKLYEHELVKYDPIEDSKGGHTHAHGITKPGGHYKEIRDIQRGLKNSLKDFSDNGCTCECLKIRAKPILDKAERYSNADIPVPLGQKFIPLESNRK